MGKVSLYSTHFLKTKKVIGYGRVKDVLYLLKVGFVGLGNTSEFKHGMIAIFKDVNQELFVTIDWGIVFCSFKLFPTLSNQCTTKNIIL